MELDLKARGMSKRARRTNALCWSVLGPTLLYYTIFSIVPLFLLVWYSLTDMYALMPDDYNFIWFRQYATIIKSARFWSVMWNTLVISLPIMVLAIVLGFLVALMLVADIRAKGFFRVIWYLPCVVSMAIISQMVSVIIRPDGLLNSMLQALRIYAPDEYTVWTFSTFWMRTFIVILCVWKGLGGNILLFMAGLTGIPVEVKEAARIDGANGFQIMTRITIPLIKPMFAFVVINSVIGIFGLFEPVQLISYGGPDGTTNTVMYEIYNQAFQNYEQGYASAMSVIVTIITLILTKVSTKLTDSDLVEGKG